MTAKFSLDPWQTRQQNKTIREKNFDTAALTNNTIRLLYSSYHSEFNL